MCDFHWRGFCAEAGPQVKMALLALTALLSIVIFHATAQAADDTYTCGSSSNARRRNYAGGMDDSDLCVQTAKRVVQQQEEDVDPDHYELEAPEYNMGGESFGE